MKQYEDLLLEAMEDDLMDCVMFSNETISHTYRTVNRHSFRDERINCINNVILALIGVDLQSFHTKSACTAATVSPVNVHTP